MIDSSTFTKRDAALAYGERGLRIFPLHTVTDGVCSCGKESCDRSGKHPRIRGWQEKASSDPQQIEEWWSRWPDANIGLLSGGDNGLVVLDGDAKHGVDSFEELDRRIGPLPDTALSKSGSGGVHAFFRHPGEPVPSSVGKLADGVDVRADGGYVVVPPSANGNGSYEWLTKFSLEVLAELPDPLLLRLVRRDARTERIPEGQRNTTLTSLGGKLRREGLEEDDILTVLSVANRVECNPPLPEDEVEQIAKSLGRYEPDSSIPRVTITPISTRDFCAQVEDDADELLLGPFIPRGSRVILTGHAGHGKSTLTYQMVNGLVTGDGFLGSPGSPGCRILLIDAEQSKRTVRKRLQEAGLDLIDGVDVVTAGLGLRLDGDPRDLVVLDQVVAGYDVVVLDPLYRLTTGDMIENKTFSPVIDTLERWRDEYGTTVVLVTHPRKRASGYSGHMRLDDIFGSAAAGWTVDQAFGIERKATGKARLHILKDRDERLEQGSHLDLVFERPRGFDFDPYAASTKRTCKDFVQEIVSEHPEEFTHGDLIREIRERYGEDFKDRSIRNALDDLGAVGSPDGAPKTKQKWSLPSE